MNLTREQAVAEFRNQWRWIAEKTLERKLPVIKKAYFYENDIKDIPKCGCYLCEYANVCSECPIPRKKEDDDYCDCCNGLFYQWVKEPDYIKAADLAAQIAELPEVE